jgi:hypothetical protein
MQTAALTFAAVGSAILFLGAIAAVGDASRPLQVAAFLLGCGYLWIWGGNLARGRSWRAATLLVLSAAAAELLLVYFAVFIEPHVRIFATSAAPVLALAIGCSYLAPAER